MKRNLLLFAYGGNVWGLAQRLAEEYSVTVAHAPVTAMEYARARQAVANCDLILAVFSAYKGELSYGATKQDARAVQRVVSAAAERGLPVMSVIYGGTVPPSLPDSVQPLRTFPWVAVSERDFAENLLYFKRAVQTQLSTPAPVKRFATTLSDVPAPFAYGWSETARLRIISGPQNTPSFPFTGSEKDHSTWLESCRRLADRLLSDVTSRKSNIRSDYGEALRRYYTDLPERAGEGNFVLADSEARILRSLFEAEASILPAPFASRLKVLLEQHIALRPFYPEVERLYRAVREGRLEEPLPQDAVEAIAATVREHTPDVFEPEISSGLSEVSREHLSVAAVPEDAGATVIVPPPDPIGPMEATKSRAFLTASSVNALYKAFLQGKDLPKAVSSWNEIAHKLGASAEPIIRWLRDYLSGGS